MKTRRILAVSLSVAAMLPALLAQPAGAVDLLERYPTTLTTGDARGDHARPCRFTSEDIYQVTRFTFKVGDALKVEAGAADLGIGHCADGATWAVLIPRAGGTMTSSAAKRDEAVAHVWLRFHPGEISRLFPANTVLAAGNASLSGDIATIARGKMTTSWQASGKAMIPGPAEMTVFVDTKDGAHRFFMVDTQAKTAEYISEFNSRRFDIRLSQSQSQDADSLALDSAAPVVVKTTPEAGVRNVAPGTVDVRITFSKEMADQSWSWSSAWKDSEPESIGKPYYDADRRTCVLKVKLEPNKTYGWWINSQNHYGFKDQQGKSAVPYLFVFQTKDK